jgi:hypothetical protein
MPRCCAMGHRWVMAGSYCVLYAITEAVVRCTVACGAAAGSCWQLLLVS